MVLVTQPRTASTVPALRVLAFWSQSQMTGRRTAQSMGSLRVVTGAGTSQQEDGDEEGAAWTGRSRWSGFHVRGSRNDVKGCAWGFLEKSLPGRTTARMQTWTRERAWLVSG